jgi:adenylate cyclase
MDGMGIWQKLHDRVCGEGRACLPDAAEDRLSLAIREEEYAALRLAITVRFVVCATVALLLTFILQWPMAFGYYGYIAALALSGSLQLRMRRPEHEQGWMLWLFPLLDMAILVAAIVLPNPFDPHPIPAPMRLGFDTVLYLTVFVVLSGLGQSARTVMYTTVAAMLAWTAGFLYLASLPNVTVVGNFDNLATQSAEARLAYLFDPWNLRIGELIPRLVLIGMIGSIMATCRGISRRTSPRRWRRWTTRWAR